MPNHFVFKSIPGLRRIASGLVPSRESGRRPDVTSIVISVGIVILMVPQNMWLPLERLSVNGQDSVNAYVLQVSSEWTTLLTEQREIRIVSTDRVEARDICRPATSATLGALMLQIPRDSAAPTCS